MIIHPISTRKLSSTLSEHFVIVNAPDYPQRGDTVQINNRDESVVEIQLWKETQQCVEYILWTRKLHDDA